MITKIVDLAVDSIPKSSKKDIRITVLEPPNENTYHVKIVAVPVDSEQLKIYALTDCESAILSLKHHMEIFDYLISHGYKDLKPKLDTRTNYFILETCKYIYWAIKDVKEYLK